MPISRIHPINKRSHEVSLNTGTVVEISVEKMAEVAVYLGQQEAGRLRFRVLSSLNNPEISPLYSLYEMSVHHTALLHAAREISVAAIALFKEYTNGRVRIGQEVEHQFHGSGLPDNVQEN